jgi:hypothetical protein
MASLRSVISSRLLEGLCMISSKRFLAGTVLVCLNRSNIDFDPSFAVKMSRSLNVWLSIVKCSNKVLSYQSKLQG